VVQDVRVRRIVLSEQDRQGIGTFQPKDEKNQDSTELTGDINYRKIAEYGTDSDPRAFNFDGEFNIANRGIIEFIEVLKLDVAFLYDLLGASQEHKIKPKKFSQTDIDEVIIGHTNERHGLGVLRLEEPSRAIRSQIEKMCLYDGRPRPTSMRIRWSSCAKSPREGMGDQPALHPGIKISHRPVRYVSKAHQPS
jgi:predicted Ser/Thr protein kinase